MKINIKKKLYKLLVKMHETDYIWLCGKYQLSPMFGIIPKKNYTLSDFFNYLPSCIIIGTLTIINFIINKLDKLNFIIAESE
jgi:hypothetical protein